MNTDNKCGSLDRFRILAAILIITIHTSPLAFIDLNADFFLTRILARIAVPFFFMVTGQFVVTRLLSVHESAKHLLIKYLIKTGIVYGTVILLYIPVGIYAGHYNHVSLYGYIRMLLFDGTFYHLWYFPACMTGVILIYCMSRFMKLRTITIMAVVLYVCGLLGDSYYGIVEKVPAISYVYSGMFRVFSYTRNGFFLAPLFLLMGVHIGRDKNRYRRLYIVTGLAVSFLLMTVEAFVLHNCNFQRHDSMYIMLIPVMWFLYQLLLDIQCSQSQRCRRITALVYVIHPVMIIVVRAGAKAFNLTGLILSNGIINFISVVLLSFAAAWGMIILQKYEHKPVYRKGRAWIELSRSALEANVSYLRSRLPDKCELMPAVKADAYGHGAVIVAKELNHLGIKAFCVACANEGASLRRRGIKGVILVLGYTAPEQFELLHRYHLTQTVIDYDYAVELSNYSKKIHVHIGIDTGMHRLGERCENIDRICEIFNMKNLIVEGVMTHLSADDSLEPANQDFTNKQADNFYLIVDELIARGYKCPKLHLQSSYGVLNYPELAEDYARVGIALYGVLSTAEDTSMWQDKLTPVLSLRCRVASVRRLYQNESAGYGIKCFAEQDMKIATLAIGYADGLSRSLSYGRGYVLINGEKAPVVGLICMDQTIVDISNIDSVKEGDIATIIGTSGNEKINVTDIAETTDTIANEVLSRLGSRLERIIE